MQRLHDAIRLLAAVHSIVYSASLFSIIASKICSPEKLSLQASWLSKSTEYINHQIARVRLAWPGSLGRIDCCPCTHGSDPSDTSLVKLVSICISANEPPN